MFFNNWYNWFSWPTAAERARQEMTTTTGAAPKPSNSKRNMINTKHHRASTLSLCQDPEKKPPEFIREMLSKKEEDPLNEHKLRSRRRWFYAWVEETHTKRGELPPPEVVSDLEQVRSKSSTRLVHAAALARLIEGYPEMWARAESERGVRTGRTTSTRKECEANLRSGNTNHLELNIKNVGVAADDRIPNKMAFILSQLPVGLMSDLSCFYGDPAIQQTVLGGSFGGRSQAVSIHLSAYDQSLMDTYKELSTKGQKTDTLMKMKTVEESECNEAIFRSSLEHLGREHHKAENDEAMPLTAFAQTIVDSKQTNTDDWKPTVGMKTFQLNWSGRENTENWVDEAKKYFADAWNIDAWWFRQPRTKYFFHHWDCGMPNPGIDVECHDVIEAGKSPYDSPVLDKVGVKGLSTLDSLVRESLERVFKGDRRGPVNEQQPPPAPAAATAAATWASSVDQNAEMHSMFGNPPDTAAAAAAGGMLLEEVEDVEMDPEQTVTMDMDADQAMRKMKDDIAFFPGVLKSGLYSVHQRLHIDNADLIGSYFLDKVLGGKYASITDREWLEGGYFVDLPLSREGSWLRIAVPDPENKRFILDYVYVPFGSCLVRSGALFHSGHYGSPGNTRLHAVVFLRGSRTNTKELGYLDRVTTPDKKRVGAGWSVEWAREIDENPSKLNFRRAENVMAYSTKAIKAKKISGTTYYNNYFKDIAYIGFDTYQWMLNPSAGHDVVLYDDEDSGVEGAAPPNKPRSNRRKTPPTSRVKGPPTKKPAARKKG